MKLAHFFRTIVVLQFIVGSAMYTTQASGQDRAFRGHDDVIVAPPVQGEDESHLIFSAIGRGEATHMGLFNREETLVLDLDTFTVTGAITFTSHLGDQIFIEFIGGFTGPTTVEGIHTITGGTGRFAGASGEAMFLAEVSPDLSQATVVFAGTIDY